jgi:hypothetical protein
MYYYSWVFLATTFHNNRYHQPAFNVWSIVFFVCTSLLSNTWTWHSRNQSIGLFKLRSASKLVVENDNALNARWSRCFVVVLLEGCCMPYFIQPGLWIDAYFPIVSMPFFGAYDHKKLLYCRCASVWNSKESYYSAYYQAQREGWTVYLKQVPNTQKLLPYTHSSQTYKMWQFGKTRRKVYSLAVWWYPKPFIKPQNWCANDSQTHLDGLAKRGGSILLPIWWNPKP